MWIFTELMLCDHPHHPVELLGIHKEQEQTNSDFEQAVHGFADHTDVKEDVNHPVSVVNFHGLLVKTCTRRAWTQSVQGAVATWSDDGTQDLLGISHAITDQVATAPCTDCVQE